MTEYQKHFVHETVADSYAKVRPTYPPALFELIASLTQHRERAWDVGCGNGQATVSIAENYKSVVATDVSEPQLARALQRPNITYTKMSATPESAEELEQVVGPEGSVDLVTVATAMHWFDLDKFYPIVKHVLRKQGGLLAAWSYGGQTVRVSPEFDEALDRFLDTAKPYRKASDFTSRRYKNVPFPFEPVPGVEAGIAVEGNPMEIKMEQSMSFDNFLTLLNSGSPLQIARDQGVHLLNEETTETLSKAWGRERVRTIEWPIFLLLGTVSAVAST